MVFLVSFDAVRSFPYFAVRSSSEHEGKIIIFEISLFLDENYAVKLTIGKINWKVWKLLDLSQLL